MRIAILSRYQNLINRGAETFVRELSKRLRKDQIVDILSGKDADSLSKIVSGKYDVVISINGRGQSLKISFGRLFSKYKLIIPGQSGIGWDVIWNTAIVQPDIFIALTDYMASWVRNWVWNSKVVKIPNGVDLDKFKPEGMKLNLNLPRPVILSVGALAWYKYHDRVIKAVSKMKEGSILIVGEGDEKEKLEKLGRDHLGQRFKISSFDYEEMPQVYRSADLFTLPSWGREAFGTVYLEAMASGLAIVAPDDSPRREIIGDAGIFTDVSDPQKYAQALNECLKRQWSNQPRRQAEKFSWEKVADEYEKIFKDLVH